MVETLSRLLPENPVLSKEMRVRMRGSRAYALMFGYVGFLAIVMLLTYWGWLQNASNYGGYSRVSQLGTQLYFAIYLTQVCLAFVITPAITSGSITLEREQRTLEMLTMTRLSLPKIVFGKLLSGVLFTTLLLVTSLPLIALTVTFGGIDPAMILETYALLFMGSILMGSLGVMCSGLAKNTTQAIVYTYLAAIVVAIASMMLYAGYAAHQNANYDLISTLYYAVSVNWYGNRFLGFAVPEGFGFFVTALLLSAIFLMVAVSRLEAKPERRTGQLRGLTTLFFGTQIYSAFRWLATDGSPWKGLSYSTSEMGSDPLAMASLVLVIPAFLLMVLVPIFCTGERNKAQREAGSGFFWQGFTPTGLREGLFNSGLPFLLMLSLLSVVLFYASGLRGIGVAAVATLFVAIFGFSSFCQFLSVLFRNRVVSWLFASLFYGYIALVPIIASGNFYASQKKPPFGFFVDAAYFDPIAAIVQKNGINVIETSSLTLGAIPIWEVLIIIWVGVALLSNFAIRTLSRKSSRI